MDNLTVLKAMIHMGLVSAKKNHVSAKKNHV